MKEVSKTDYANKDIDVNISEITDGSYRISGFSNEFGITFNQFCRYTTTQYLALII